MLRFIRMGRAFQWAIVVFAVFGSADADAGAAKDKLKPLHIALANHSVSMTRDLCRQTSWHF